MGEPTALKVTIGKNIDVGDVISRSARIVARNPLLLVPQLVATVPSIIISLLEPSSVLNLWRVLGLIISLLLSVIISGTYPLMVKSVLDGVRPSVSGALLKATRRLLGLIAAAILVGIVVVLGTFALVVPGIIFLTWFFYTIPAMMLEDKGPLVGMRASRAFGRDKKLSTFLIIIVIAIGSGIVGLIEFVLGFASPYLMVIGQLVLGIPLSAWLATIPSYTYITYGPSSVPATPEGPIVISPGLSQFCANCGKPVRPGSSFCPSCGSPITYS
jgi:hypothetical protein